ncbi:hypothetical protein ACFSKL_02815 [Belliella marina]|uniref:Uncharacterized protein n=1 Tax=Belliella marina TaxID=1644146 RepID=A0ABW4VKB1_9BACT
MKQVKMFRLSSSFRFDDFSIMNTASPIVKEMYNSLSRILRLKPGDNKIDAEVYENTLIRTPLEYREHLLHS